METNMATADNLDLIDSLRSDGVDHYIDLPKIIVCGDQSAGKSSVLEAISRWPFPTRDGVCTRFATELVLRRGAKETARASIIPSKTRSPEDKARLEAWQSAEAIGKDGIGQITEEAELAMSGEKGTTAFYEDILRIELTGPKQPHLTMIDLPGIFHSRPNKQSDRFVKLVKKLTTRYMKRSRSIILTVVSAKADIDLQEITTLARNADSKGLRTLGLITKPDTLDVGSEAEDAFVQLVQNKGKDLHLDLGWHILKNRNYAERHVDSDQRDAIESDFFSQGAWRSVHPSLCGVAALNTRLSKLLTKEVNVALPKILREIETDIDQCNKAVHDLGPVRITQDDQDHYLMQVSEKYTSLMTHAVDGTYDGTDTRAFFSSQDDLQEIFEEFPARLRAVIQDQLDDFGHRMRLIGHSECIFESDNEDKDKTAHTSNNKENHAFKFTPAMPRVSRSDYIERVKRRLKYSRGRELKGLFNPLIITDLFADQSKPWADITHDLINDILFAVRQTAQLIVKEATEGDVFERVLDYIEEEIEARAVKLKLKVENLLASAAQHPITYNLQLIETVQQVQCLRNERALEQVIRSSPGFGSLDNSDAEIKVNAYALLNGLKKHFEPNMEQFGSSFAVDYMQAYYKVALNRFIDDISVLAIEDCLLKELPTLFKYSTVSQMSNEEKSLLAGETEECSLQRAELQQRLGVLQTSLKKLRKAVQQGNIARTSRKVQAASTDAEQARAVVSTSFGGTSTVKSGTEPDTGLPTPPAEDSSSPPKSAVTTEPHRESQLDGALQNDEDEL